MSNLGLYEAENSKRSSKSYFKLSYVSHFIAELKLTQNKFSRSLKVFGNAKFLYIILFSDGGRKDQSIY